MKRQRSLLFSLNSLYISGSSPITRWTLNNCPLFQLQLILIKTLINYPTSNCVFIYIYLNLNFKVKLFCLLLFLHHQARGLSMPFVCSQNRSRCFMCLKFEHPEEYGLLINYTINKASINN